MGLFNKLFGGGKSKESAMEEAYSLFDTAKSNIMEKIIKGLSDPNLQVRKEYAELIQDNFIPALSLDNGPLSKSSSLKTLHNLIAELRPPKNDDEMNDLNNAAFYYTRLLVREQSQK